MTMESSNSKTAHIPIFICAFKESDPASIVRTWHVLKCKSIFPVTSRGSPPKLPQNLITDHSTGMPHCRETTIATMEDPKQTRTFQACTQCRSRKLKCIMDPTDGGCTPPCKRCRRESKQCTVPPPKRKRHVLESASTWTPAKRQQAKQTVEAASRPSSPPLNPVPAIAIGRRPSPDILAPSLASAERNNKRQRMFEEPRIRDAHPSDDSFMTSMGAPWAMDFLPVTFCGMIAGLSQAYDNQTSSVPSEITSSPSTADGDDREEPEQAISPHEEPEPEPEPQTVSMANMHMPAPNRPDHTGTGALIQAHGATAKGTDTIDGSYQQDLGLDDIFDYFRFD